MTKAARATGGLFAATTRKAATRVGDMTYVKHDQFIGRSLKTYGEWAQLEIDQQLKYIAPGDFVIDVGANIGFHALSFARRVGKSGVVWAFEPDPVNGLLLRHNILQSGLDGVVLPFDLAVSDTLEICRFRTVPIGAPDNFGHTGVDPVDGDYLRIALPLDALMIDRAPALIKIDIEGHEQAALAGMSELIAKHRPVLSIEADTPDEVEASGELLAGMGYDVYSLVVNAYNSANFAENPTDIWKGYGRCANLLCVMPDKHRAPEGLDLVRRGEPERHAASRLGKTVGAAFSALSTPEKSVGGLTAEHGLSMARTEIRRFISSFLKTTYGKLDPVTDAAIVDGALDFLAANEPAAQGAALQQLIVAGVQTFVEALEDRAKAKELATLQAERERLRVTIDELQSDSDVLRNERKDLEGRHESALADVTTRLAAAKAAEARLSAELAQQTESARRDVAAALTQAEEATRRAEAAEAQAATISSRLETAREEADKTAIEVAQLLEDKQALALEIATLEGGHKTLSADLAEAESRAEAAEAQAARLASDLAAREADLQAATSDLAEREAALVAARAGAEKESARLSAELAQQAEAARRDVAAALAQAEEATRRAEAAEAQVEELASAHETLGQQLAQAIERQDQLQSELAACKTRAGEEAAELVGQLEAAKGEADKTAMQVAQLLEDKQELKREFSRLESQRTSLSSQLAEAQERLALQAQQLRQLRLA